MNAIETESELEVFHGEATVSYAHLYIRFACDNTEGAYQLTGTVRGPYCEYAQTLPATFLFEDLGAGSTALARATVADPSSWTPDLPSTYRVVAQLERDGKVERTFELDTAVRRWGAVKRSFSLDSQRWVVRAAGESRKWADDPQALTRAYRDLKLALVVKQPGADLLRHATQMGLAVIIDGSAESELPAWLRVAASFPCVMGVVVGSAESAVALKSIVPNVLIGTPPIVAGDAPAADFLFVAREQVASVATELPVVVHEVGEIVDDALHLRRQLERLQEAICPASLAGYCILG